MTTLTQTNTKTNNYIFETHATWKVPVIYYRISSTAYLDGKLGLTDNGRIEFTLQNGKVIFSAPISQTQMRVHAFSTITARFGRYRYMFLHNKFDEHGRHKDSTETVGEQWKRQIARYQTVPADNLPVINTDVPSAASATLQFLALAIVIIAASIYGALFLSRNPVLSLPANDIAAGALFVIAGALLYIWLIWRIHAVERHLLGDNNSPKQ